MSAPASMLIATTVFAALMPARCCTAPEMPTAMYRSGATHVPRQAHLQDVGNPARISHGPRAARPPPREAARPRRCSASSPPRPGRARPATTIFASFETRGPRRSSAAVSRPRRTSASVPAFRRDRADAFPRRLPGCAGCECARPDRSKPMRAAHDELADHAAAIDRFGRDQRPRPRARARCNPERVPRRDAPRAAAPTRGWRACA